MNEILASQIVKAAVALDSALGELDVVVSKIPDGAERQVFARAVADVIGQINDSIIRPIVRRHPKLDPDV